jgi:hypothetical protein
MIPGKGDGVDIHYSYIFFSLLMRQYTGRFLFALLFQTLSLREHLHMGLLYSIEMLSRVDDCRSLYCTISPFLLDTHVVTLNPRREQAAHPDCPQSGISPATPLYREMIL